MWRGLDQRKNGQLDVVREMGPAGGYPLLKAA